MQDHDRALIVGETTFGKGLVQTVFQVSENTGLALTTYHYYTPSGRLIQRNYSNISLYDYYYVREGVEKGANREVKLTDSGRTVYGGGGITPDEKIDAPKANHFQDTLAQHYAFFNFSKHYLANHTVSKDFQVDDAVLSQFKDFLKTKEVEYTDADLNGVMPWIKASIKKELFTSQFGQLGRPEGHRRLGPGDRQGGHVYPGGAGSRRITPRGTSRRHRFPTDRLQMQSALRSLNQLRDALRHGS